MLDRAKQTIKVLFGITLIGKHLPIFSDDVFITSYPRSGNTWLRFLIANAANPNDDVGFWNIEEMAEEVTCPSRCLTGNTRRIGAIPGSDAFAGRRLEHALDGGSLLACDNCNLRFRFPRLPKQDLDRLYEIGVPEAWHCAAEERGDWQIASDWLGKSLPEGADVFDVGCSTGQFLIEVLSDRFRKFGLEINAVAAKKAEMAGVTLVAGDFGELTGLSGGAQFDAITAFDVIEHVENPLVFLKTLVSLLKPHGRIILSSGNTSAWSWRLMGSRYWYCTIPEHISFINPEWCRRAAPKCGLSVKRHAVFSHSAHPSLGQKSYQFTANVVFRFAPGLFRMLRRAGFGRKDGRKDPTLAAHPPSWMTAKDHFITEFERRDHAEI